MHALDADTALAVLRIAAGLVLAAHGAQKVFGVFEGPGLERWTGVVASLGFAQPRALATLQSFTELFGGLALVVGFYTPAVAALLAVNLLVATLRVHARNGPWVSKGGYEYSLVLLVIVVVLGLTGAPAYSVDVALGLVSNAVVMFAVAFVLAGVLTLLAGSVVAPREAHRTARG